MNRKLTAALAASLLAAIPATAAHAAPAPGAAVVQSISMSWAEVELWGPQTALMDVRVRITDPNGVVATGDSSGGWTVWLTYDDVQKHNVLLKLDSGTPQDGYWVGQVQLTTGWAGTKPWVQARVATVHLTETDGTRVTLTIDPAAFPDEWVRVRSTGHPLLKITFSPSPALPGSAVTQTIRATNADTGKPWPRLKLSIGLDSGCTDYPGTTTVTTSAAGTYSRKLSAQAADNWLTCAYLLGPPIPFPDLGAQPTVISSDARFVTHKFVVTAKPARTSVKHGTNVAVNGGLRPGSYHKLVYLQRLYPGKVWKTVNSATADTRQRYTVNATPPGRATYSYRVQVLTEPGVVGSTSPVFTIRGT